MRVIALMLLLLFSPSLVLSEGGGHELEAHAAPFIEFNQDLIRVAAAKPTPIPKRKPHQ